MRCLNNSGWILANGHARKWIGTHCWSMAPKMESGVFLFGLASQFLNLFSMPWPNRDWLNAPWGSEAYSPSEPLLTPKGVCEPNPPDGSGAYSPFSDGIRGMPRVVWPIRYKRGQWICKMIISGCCSAYILYSSWYLRILHQWREMIWNSSANKHKKTWTEEGWHPVVVVVGMMTFIMN